MLTFNRAAGGLTPLQSSWTLDGVGNWLSVNGQSQQFSSTNELVQTAPAAGGPATIVYDNNGNETDDGTYLYTYDAENRLRTVTLKSNGDLIAVYSYDALGRRIQKVVTNSGSLNGTTEYDYDGPQDIEEHNGSGTLTQQYVYGNGTDEVLVMDRNLTGGPTATAPGDQRLFYYQNALGSVFALTDILGKILEAYLYDAYGRQTVLDPGPAGVVVFGAGDIVTPGGVSLVGNPFMFTGLRLDPETGLYYARTRYLDPVLGRYISRDPIGIWGDPSANGDAYSYVSDDPTNLADPYGTEPVTATVLALGLKCALGAIAGVAFDQILEQGWNLISEGVIKKPDLCQVVLCALISCIMAPVASKLGLKATEALTAKLLTDSAIVGGAGAMIAKGSTTLAKLLIFAGSQTAKRLPTTLIKKLVQLGCLSDSDQEILMKWTDITEAAQNAIYSFINQLDKNVENSPLYKEQKKRGFELRGSGRK